MMNKQEVMKHIRNVLKRELDEVRRDIRVTSQQYMELDHIQYEILEYLDNNLLDDWTFKLTPSATSSSVSEENIRRIVRDEIHKVLRREHLKNE